MAKSKTGFIPNATAVSLLGFLHEKPMTGWQLARLAQERIGNFWHLTKSQVYSELEKLAKHGLVQTTERGQRESRKFTLSERGRQAFRVWLERAPLDEQVRSPMLLTISFSQFIAPATRYSLLHAYLASHQARLQSYKKTREELKHRPEAPDSLRTLDFGIAYESMTVRWLKETIVKEAR